MQEILSAQAAGTAVLGCSPASLLRNTSGRSIRPKAGGFRLLIYTSTVGRIWLMKTSTRELGVLLTQLTNIARARGLNDSQWASAAGLPKETLSRLRRRASCDLATLNALAGAVGARLAVRESPPVVTAPDGHFPDRMGREYEARLLALAASGNLDPEEWRAMGPAFFMAGIAVMLASVGGLGRRGLLALAEALHPGSSHPDVFQAWLARSLLRPSRFLPMLRKEPRRAA